MRIWLILIFSNLGILSFLPAQSLTPSIIASDGGIDQAASVQLEWTIGEPAIENKVGQTNQYSEGFHQPTILIEEIVIPTEDRDMETQHINTSLITVAPNPVADELVVSFGVEEPMALLLTLFDANGVMLLRHQVNTLDGQAKVNLSDFAPGFYMIQFTSPDARVHSLFKLTKIQ